MIDAANISSPIGGGSAWRSWLRRVGMGLRRRVPVKRIDLESTPDDLLRDIGLCDGRGPSLRRPERQP